MGQYRIKTIAYLRVYIFKAIYIMDVSSLFMLFGWMGYPHRDPKSSKQKKNIVKIERVHPRYTKTNPYLCQVALAWMKSVA